MTIEKFKKEGKKGNVDKLKALQIAPFKFEPVTDSNGYVMVIRFPFETKITKEGNFCKLFRFTKYMQLNA